MSTACPTCESGKTVGYVIGVVGLFLVIGWLACLVASRTQPEPLNQARVAERLRASRELAQANAEALNNYGVIDPGKGVIRLPVSRAMELTIQQWKDPAAARSNLLSAVENSTAPAPKAPEKPSQFE